jgi:rubrerythrin
VSETKAINSVGELLAHARVMETEAYECYLDLAEQMEVHNNNEVADLFRQLASEEKKHVDKVDMRAGDEQVPHMAPWDFKSFETESHGLTGAREVHYMMTPYHALALALRAEQRSLDFFTQVVETASDAQTLEMARDLMEEERHHVELIKQWLAKEPKPEENWDEDPDPPVLPT